MANPYVKQYKQMAVKTASRGQILIMLYEAAIQSLKKACIAIEQKNIAQKATHITKAHDILLELQTSLDFNQAKEIAEQLDGLYNWMIKQLLEANMESSKEKIEHIIKLLTNLLEGWRTAVTEFEKTQAGYRENGNT